MRWQPEGHALRALIEAYMTRHYRTAWRSGYTSIVPSIAVQRLAAAASELGCVTGSRRAISAAQCDCFCSVGGSCADLDHVVGVA